MPRDRLFIFFVDDSCGGFKGATWVASAFRRMAATLSDEEPVVNHAVVTALSSASFGTFCARTTVG